MIIMYFYFAKVIVEDHINEMIAVTIIYEFSKSIC